MTDEEQLILFVLGPVYVLGMVVIFMKFRQAARVADKSQVQDEEGAFRKPTANERADIVHWLLFHESRRFWLLVAAGVLLVAGTWTILRLVGWIPIH